MKKYIIALVALALLNPSFAQKDKKLVDKTVTKADIEAHIGFLASDAMRGRNVNTPELKIAAEYLKTQLKLSGVKAFDQYPDYLQPVSMFKTTPPSTGTISLDSTTAYQLRDNFIMLTGEDMDWSGDYVTLPYGLEEEYEGVDVKGKLVFAACGDGESESVQGWVNMHDDKIKWAKEAGAIGLVEFYGSPQYPWSLIANYLGRENMGLKKEGAIIDFPHLWISNSGNEVAKSLIEREDKSVSLSLDGAAYEEFTSYNVVGYIPGSEKPNEYVTYSAHYDHVGIGVADSTGDNIYNGTRDNAVGTTTVLSTAKNIGQYPTKRSALFILFTAEEKGLLGSEWYVDNSPVPLNQIVYCFNSDNGGYNDVTKATIFGFSRTTAKEDFALACTTYGLEAVDDNMPEQNLFDRSDNVNFARKGIPAPTFSMGITAFDEEILKYYHQPSDNPNSVDYDYLFKFFRAYVYAARIIANRDEPPFWIDGDKYFDAGKALYGN